MATNIARLNVSIVGNGKAFRVDMTQNTRAVARFGKATSVVQAQVLSLGRTFLAGFGVAGLTASLVSLTRAAEEFNSVFTRSIAIQELSEKQILSLRKTVQATARDFQATTSELSTILFDLASAGFALEEQQRGLARVAEFAQAGGLSAQAAGGIATDIIGAFNLEATAANIREISDVLTRLNVIGKGTLQEFGEGVKRLGPTAAGVGLEFRDAAVFINAFNERGIRAEKAATSAAAVLTRLTAAQKKNAAAWKDLEISLFDANQELLKPADIARQLERVFGDLPPELQITAASLLGVDSELTKLTLTLLGTSDAMDRFDAAAGDALGTTREISDKAVPELNKSLKSLTEDIKVFGTNLLDFVEEPLTELIDNTADEFQFLASIFGDIELGPDRDVIDRWEAATKAIKEQEAAQQDLSVATDRTAERQEAINRLTQAQNAKALRDAEKERTKELEKQADALRKDLGRNINFGNQPSFVRGTRRSDPNRIASSLAGLDRAIRNKEAQDERKRQTALLAEIDATLSQMLAQQQDTGDDIIVEIAQATFP